MEVSQKLSAVEIQVLLSGLEIITIKGSHARLVANLQDKLVGAQDSIAKKIQAEEEKKEAGLKELVKR
jgi:hypothetical protein|tara:strand:- start:261 stop:464 length:204 start_codon:yes stop_codon:yes gene_type:complete